MIPSAYNCVAKDLRALYTQFMSGKSGKRPGSSKSARGMTKAQLVGELASKSALSKSQVSSVFTALAELIGAELKGGRPVTIPNLVKVTVQHKSATPARPGRSPFTGEMMTFKAKPARRVVKVRAVKALKDLL